MYYQADIINGVTIYGDLMDDPFVDIMEPKDFAEALDTLEEGEVIYTYVAMCDRDFWETVEKD